MITLRPVMTLALAGAAVLSLPASAQDTAPPPVSGDDPEISGYQCTATAREQKGETVSVSLYLDLDGKLLRSTASWRPPQEGDIGRGDLTRPDVALWISFDQTSVGTIGRPVGALLSVSVFSPLRDRVSPAKLAARLTSYMGRYRFGDGAFVPLTGFSSAPDTSLPGSAQVTDMFDLPQPLPGSIEIEVLDKKRHVVTQTRYVLNPAQSRDVLFRTVWTQAQSAAANVKNCAPHGTDLIP